MLDSGVVVEAVGREVLAVAGVLEATVRHLRDERNVRVDPHAAEIEVLGESHRAGVVPGPDARREPVLHPVGPLEGLLLVRELLHGDDRPEDLVLDGVVSLLEARHDRRLVEVAARSLAVPAELDRGRATAARR